MSERIYLFRNIIYTLVYLPILSVLRSLYGYIKNSEIIVTIGIFLSTENINYLPIWLYYYRSRRTICKCNVAELSAQQYAYAAV